MRRSASTESDKERDWSCGRVRFDSSEEDTRGAKNRARLEARLTGRAEGGNIKLTRDMGAQQSDAGT